MRIQCGRCPPLACPWWGHRHPPLAKFCANCGTSLATSSPLSPTIVSPTFLAERRQLTVMFCDLVGSTALSVRLDPEDLREVIVAYQIYVAETVVRFGGFVAHHMGDGVLVHFGYPPTHEHASERAAPVRLELGGGIIVPGMTSD